MTRQEQSAIKQVFGAHPIMIVSKMPFQGEHSGLWLTPCLYRSLTSVCDHISDDIVDDIADDTANLIANDISDGSANHIADGIGELNTDGIGF